LVGFAIGSETNGSIVTPSAFCGVTGLRPTYGLVSRAGAMALSWTMDKLGPMCRSAEDCGLVLQTIAGGDNEDPGSAGKSFYFAPQFVRPFNELRVGFALTDFEEAAEAPLRPVFREALGVLKSIGLPAFKEVALSPDYPYGAVAATIVSCEGSTVFEELITSGRVDELADQRQAQGLKAGLEIPAKDYLRATRIRAMIQQMFRELLYEVDILVAPARTSIASRINEPLDRLRDASVAAQPKGLNGLTAAGNLAGLPSLCLPCGFADKMPVGLQLVGRPFTENVLLKVGMEFQKATNWHRQMPPAN
jgi:aspartyl-tRNA(Asn)/glutamyl-tRNA(Gln) amidotransferase subunit A